MNKHPAHPSFSSWSELGIALSLLLPYQNDPQAPWMRHTISDSGTPGRIKAYELTEAVHAKTIEETIERWILTGELPELEKSVSSLITLRFNVVGNLLSTLDGIIDYPNNLTTEEILAKFLFVWWKRTGSMQAVGYTVSET